MEFCGILRNFAELPYIYQQGANNGILHALIHLFFTSRTGAHTAVILAVFLSKVRVLHKVKKNFRVVDICPRSRKRRPLRVLLTNLHAYCKLARCQVGSRNTFLINLKKPRRSSMTVRLPSTNQWSGSVTQPSKLQGGVLLFFNS